LEKAKIRMGFNEALDYIKAKADNAATREVRITLGEIYAVLLRASTSVGNRWARKIERVVDYVEAENICVGSRPDAAILLNKRKYE